ncbi:MAG: site-specific integrase, partial [Rhizobiaceae bacterium]|nr:site-specific integrase [Rhizobiaceae bacterium]
MGVYDLSTISDLDAISPLETFLSEISNPNTRAAYHQACTAFIHWLETIGQNPLRVRSIHIATWRELVQRRHSVATTKLYLAALRTFFDWMCEQNLIPLNPARAVKSPKEVIAVGKTSFLEPAETRMLLASLQGEQPIDLRDRALIGLMLFTFARIGAALRLNCDDLVRRGGST